jgi:hypothetical protein
MSAHTCEFDLHNCSSSDCDIYEECGAPASVKRQGHWFCEQHYEYIERYCSTHLMEKT